jgi:hypothetical protein
MNTLRIGAAAFAGLALAVVLFRTPAIKAQEPGKMVVFIHPVLVDNAKLPVDTVIPGSRVCGISCIPKPVSRLPDAAVCYVATTN